MIFSKILEKIFGTKYERDLKKIQPIINKINANYEKIINDFEILKKETKSEEEYNEKVSNFFKSKTEEFKKRIQDEMREEYEELARLKFEKNQDNADRTLLQVKIEDKTKEIVKHEKEILDEILPEAFAYVKAAAKHLIGKKFEAGGQKLEWNMVHYDVQLIGGIALHDGKIAEMATGEGKTLVATLPTYLNSLVGKGVHIVTVNDYLAKRDAEWMGQLYNLLGVSVGVIQTDMRPEQRKIEYSKDITFGTNSEFGFDYLRDNMAYSLNDMVQRGHYYAIIDEVDSVLIDEARTPLIISGQIDKPMDIYKDANTLVREIIALQKNLINKIAAEAKALLEKDENDEEAGRLLLMCQRGFPKHKQFRILMEEPSNQKLLQKIENLYLMNKSMHLIDEELFFSISEKENSINISEKGRSVLSKNIPDLFDLINIDEEFFEIENNKELSTKEKIERKNKIMEEFTKKNELLHAINQVLKAHTLFEKDVEYIVQDNKVIIVDEFTGRLMPGRRFSDGLHQALEAKENVDIQKDSQTIATITIQNYFRLYQRLAGMTGTAKTEEAEFIEIYKMEVMQIPTNKPVKRVDYDDLIYKTKADKFRAIIKEIKYLHEKEIPVLVGTISVETSELISKLLTREKIPHEVLNAKNHEREALIISKAGQKGAVTIATNMAGRGTDIKLGNGVVRDCIKCCLNCNDDCSKCEQENLYEKCMEDVPCGLHIIGTERHESRRIDRQLRGRSGRQGDPGASRFYISLEDDLMRLFGSDKIVSIMERFNLGTDGEVIQNKYLTKAIENAQKKVESINFQARKNTLEYDNVMNEQRRVIYGYRKEILEEANLRSEIIEMFSDVVNDLLDKYIPENVAKSEWEELHEFIDEIHSVFLINISYKEVMESDWDREALARNIIQRVHEFYENIEKIVAEAFATENSTGLEPMRRLERIIFLNVIDVHWMEHLYEMDNLREGIQLQAYAQKDPLIEYKKEAYKLFMDMVGKMKLTLAKNLFRTLARETAELQQSQIQKQNIKSMENKKVESPYKYTTTNNPEGKKIKSAPIIKGPKIGPNEPCPCGSGKKYKHCCGKI